MHWESVSRGSSARAWKLSSRLFSRPDWLPLSVDPRGCMDRTWQKFVGLPPQLFIQFCFMKIMFEDWVYGLCNSVMFLQRNDKPSTFVCLIAIASYTCLFFFPFSRYEIISRILKCEKRPVSFTHSSNLYLKSQAQVILKFSCQELSNTGYPTKCLVCVHLKYMFTWSYLTVTFRNFNVMLF